jgi:hypothetical protein
MTNTNYVKGRAGELTTKANKETFELLLDIFGHGGPYRNVLNEFGIGDPEYKDDFLVLKDGEVLTDIKKETEALWKPIMCKVKKEGKETKVVVDYSVKNIIEKGPKLLKKVLIDAWTVALIENYLKKAKKRYREYCAFTEKSLKTKKITRKNFLKMYEHVVYVTFLYELVYEYNTERIENKCLKTYVKQNDYLLNYDETFDEFKYKNDESFSLGKRTEKDLFKNFDGKSLNLIPSDIPDCICNAPSLINAEKLLQCLKNNMRLKTGCLLFVMNYNIQ